MFEFTDDFIARLTKFGEKTGAIIVTRAMSDDQLKELDDLLKQWDGGASEQEAIIRSKFAVDPGDEALY